ncbi:MAG: zinc-ribbon domain-containing protein [Bacteroidales bacterium]|nr:zinc-ribbon domain-containing protein [Bacteroidales bacterium]
MNISEDENGKLEIWKKRAISKMDLKDIFEKGKMQFKKDVKNGNIERARNNTLCDNCGKQIMKGDNYCPYCGHKQ